MKKVSMNSQNLNIFDFCDDSFSHSRYTLERKNIVITKEIEVKLVNYNLDSYLNDLEAIGLESTWDYICKFLLDGGKNNFLSISNFGELYEIGLAVQDKLQKKKSGQYYTPDDVALVMSEWLSKEQGTNVCDVACGTGKLILTYLDFIGKQSAIDLISKGHLYLYDFDHVALNICKTAILLKYGIEYSDAVHDIYCDFLDRNIALPEDCKVISNPPYASIDNIQDYWNHSEVLIDTKELYSSFMEKIFEQASSTVIITPFSFISGSKFFSLRKKMCKLGTGFIVAFDNVPGNIFCGRKHGIFNTNTANSVRAAITVMRKSGNKGFKVTPLIRFKNEERKKLLVTNVLEKELNCEDQIVDENNDSFRKINNSLNTIYKNWISKSSFLMRDLISKKETDYLVDMPNTCRYFTTASSKKLSRTGSITSYFSDKNVFNFIYCFVNSSFVYWWWRIYDGGITYPTSLFNNIPVPVNLLNEEDYKFFNLIAEEMIKNEKKYIVTKVNAGVRQENIKFPEEYRKKINNRILQILSVDETSEIFEIVHKNKYF